MSYVEGKYALITGSTSGIGLGIAKVLVRNGCNVIIHGSRSQSNAQSVVEEVTKEGKEGTKVFYVQADLSKSQDCRELVEKAYSFVEQDKEISILVNNAGVQFVSPIEEFEDDQWDRLIAVNLSSCFHTMKSVLKRWKEPLEGKKDTNESERLWGRIINISSVHGLVASANKSVEFCLCRCI